MVVKQLLKIIAAFNKFFTIKRPLTIIFLLLIKKSPETR